MLACKLTERSEGGQWHACTHQQLEIGVKDRCKTRCLLCRSGGTLSIDRAWMEELLMNELDTRWLSQYS